MTDLWASLSTLGTSVIVAVISSFIAVRLALKRFYAEKLWERKFTAYSAVIEALHHVREHTDTNLTATLLQREIPAEGAQQLAAQLQAAMAELRKQLDIGSFIISETAVSALNTLLDSLEESATAEYWQAHLEIKLVAIDKALPDLRRIARIDLRLKDVG